MGPNSVKMASKEWVNSQELADFKQPPKKTPFKHPVKEEDILELSKGFVSAKTKKIRHGRTKRNNNAEERC